MLDLSSIIRFAFILQLAANLIIPLKLKSQECVGVKISDFPKRDLPSNFDTAKSKPESSYKYYYGIGVPIDYVKARNLAFIEMKTNGDKEDFFEGSAILMMIYANGFGVERNLDISIRLACANVWGADAEIEGRVQHLKNRQSNISTDTFDICDDITSGLMEGMCQSIQSEKKVVIRNSKIDSIIIHWSQKNRITYNKFREAASGFYDFRTHFEVDLTGTARAMFALEESDDLEDDFFSKIVQSDKCSFSRYSLSDFEKADKALNLIYSKIMNQKESEWSRIEGAITKEGIKKTQKKWILYRDAWVSFGTAKCPEASSISLKTLITKERVKQLQELSEDK
jgi:uncharacterized protein YecT (DUF1311 family)